jgi:hypothetical protein
MEMCASADDLQVSAYHQLLTLSSLLHHYPSQLHLTSTHRTKTWLLEQNHAMCAARNGSSATPRFRNASCASASTANAMV